MKLNFILLLLIHVSLCFGGCIHSERDALLHFKTGLTDSSNRLADWAADGSDCCSWSGVVCHNMTSHVLELHLRTLSPAEYFGPHYQYGFTVEDAEEYDEYYEKSAFGGEVSSSLLHLKHLVYLDLSYNDFGGVPIPKFIGSIQSLRYLNLSRAGFGGIIPSQLGNLSNLHYLNLRSRYKYNLDVKNLDWVSRLTCLEVVDMSHVDLSRFLDWLKVMNSLPSLVELHLSGCSLSGFNPEHLSHLNFSSLSVLQLSNNYFGGPIPNAFQNMTPLLSELDFFRNHFNSSIPNWLYGLTHLQYLDLSFNELQGQISSGIGNLTSLISLDLSFNYGLEFKHGIPNSFQNFCNLKSLHLSFLKLNQELNSVLQILSSGCISHGLQFLALFSCQLSGHLTDDISFFKNLIKFDISNNRISGPIPLSLGEMVSLSYLNLRNNRLNGSLPVSFGHLNKLEHADISNNKLEGEVSELHFVNLTRLTCFYATKMGTNVVLRVSSNWIPPLKLDILTLRSWHIGPQFPKWLHLLKHLTYLDLSNSRISTPIPIWFWDSFPKYRFLNLSHNQMTGFIPNIPIADGSFMSMIDLSSNNFSGSIPYFSSNISALDLSNNSFTGSIFNLLCYKMNEVKQMEVLNIESNHLSGEIPDCWKSWKNLVALKLSNNKFSSSIPNSIGTLSRLESLHIHDNNLSGEMPSSIQNCMNLFALDFSGNNLIGKLPRWIGERFVRLTILDLSANKFDGYLPKELCQLVALHILNLAHNNFSGTIPTCFSNFTGMTIRNEFIGSFYVNSGNWRFMESVLLVMKGKVMEYSTILRFVRSIDLSNNSLSGEIPTGITSLAGLLSLNLSHNSLIGRLPNNIGDMKELEAIDFSHNQLSGEIPKSMSTLTFLGMLDLSYNNLSGKIPLGTQLQGFNSSSYERNQLCGLPLTKNCSSNSSEVSIEEKDGNEVEVDKWFYVSMTFGFVFGFWSVAGSLIFIRRWRHFYFRSLYQLGEKIW